MKRVKGLKAVVVGEERERVLAGDAATTTNGWVRDANHDTQLTRISSPRECLDTGPASSLRDLQDISLRALEIYNLWPNCRKLCICVKSPLIYFRDPSKDVSTQQKKDILDDQASHSLYCFCLLNFGQLPTASARDRLLSAMSCRSCWSKTLWTRNA